MNTEIKNNIIAKLNKISQLAAREKADALEFAHFDKAEVFHWREYAGRQVAGWFAANIKADDEDGAFDFRSLQSAAIRKVSMALVQNNYSLSATNPRHIAMAKVLSEVLEWVIDPEMM